MNRSKTASAATNIDSRKNLGRVKIAGLIATLLGILVFTYYILSVGPGLILEGVARIGAGGFAVIVAVYGLKLLTRATAWSLTVYRPNSISIRETYPAVVIGEALSSVLPLGILISGTAKAIAVRRKVPLVVGLSSVATENLFYSLVTGLFICFGAVGFARQFAIPPALEALVDGVVIVIVTVIIVGTIMVIRKWHWVSGICEALYSRGILKSILGKGRRHVRKFEDLIYGFYRAHPRRFLPLCGLQVLFHSLGVFEVWFILTRIGSPLAEASAAFFLESTSRLITVVFKLVPFLIGVDEAGAELVLKSLGVAAGIGVTMAIIRKGRVIVWALIGYSLIVKRGLSVTEVRQIRQATYEVD